MKRWLGLAMLAFSFGAAAAAPDPLAPLDFLIGQWVAPAPDDTNAPNRGGTVEFTRDLGGTVLMRRDHTLLKEGGALDMLMVIYPERGGLRADFFDSDRHVIHYALSNLKPGKRVQFTSESPSEAPAFRLTYDAKSPTAVLVRFEVAAPGPQRAFRTFAEGMMNRQ